MNNDGRQNKSNNLIIATSNNNKTKIMAAMTPTKKRPQREMSQQRGPQQQSTLDCNVYPLSPSARSTTINPFWSKSQHHHHHNRPSGGDGGGEKENEISHKKARLNKNDDDDDDDVQIIFDEETIVKIKKAEELKNKRCQNVFKFLTVRGLMLMNTTTSSEDTTATTGPPQPPSRKQRLATTLLRQIVPDMEKFQFHSTTDTNTSTSTSTTMDEWDKVLKQRLVTEFGPNCTDRLVTYKLHGGMKGITIQEEESSSTTTSDKYVATTKVDIMIRTNGFGTTAKTVLTGILTLHFRPDSALLDSASWSTIPDIEDHHDYDHNNNSFSSPSSLIIQRTPAPAPE